MQNKLEAILEQIAKKEGQSVAYIRQEMQRALDLAMASPDPIIQARWARIPKAGSKPTLEEFIAYVASQTQNKQK